MTEVPLASHLTDDLDRRIYSGVKKVWQKCMPHIGMYDRASLEEHQDALQDTLVNAGFTPEVARSIVEATFYDTQISSEQ